MLRNITIIGTAICLSMASGLARADHDRQLRYVVGGAILGAALGELAYASSHRGHVVLDYGYTGYTGYGYSSGYEYGHRYAYGPRIAYLPPRVFAHGGRYRDWGHDSRHGRPHRSGHRDGRYRR